MAIQIRRGNAADLVSANLSQGEPFVCLDTQVAGIKGNSGPIYLATGDSSGNAQNALKLGGVLAANFPQVSSGTWTPTIYGTTTAGSPVYSSASGIYYKIGKLVYLSFAMALTSLGGAVGDMRIGGLPFAVGGTGDVMLLNVANLSLAHVPLFGHMTPNHSYIDLMEQASTGSVATEASELSSTFSIWAAGGAYLAST